MFFLVAVKSHINIIQKICLHKSVKGFNVIKMQPNIRRQKKKKKNLKYSS